MRPHICLFCLSERVWKREGNLKQNSVSNWIKLFLVTKYDYMTMNCNKKSTIDNLYGQGMWHAWNVFNSLLSPWSLHDRDAWSTWSRVSCTVKQFSNVTRCKLYSFCAVDQAICTITLKKHPQSCGTTSQTASSFAWGLEYTYKWRRQTWPQDEVEYTSQATESPD